MPTLRADADYLMLVVGLLGTTITPYMQLFQQSSIVERGAARRHYGPERVDAYAGAIFSNLMSIFMIIATAATLHTVGHTAIDTAADAAKALEPMAGPLAEALFASGLLGASLLAGAVLPLATAYAISEAFGTPKGGNLDFRRACLLYPVYGADQHGGRRRAAAACADHPVAPVGPGAQRDGITSHPRFHPAAGQ